MKVTLTQGAVLSGRLRAPGEQELSEKDAKDAKELGIVVDQAESADDEAARIEAEKAEAEAKAAASKKAK